MGKIIAFLFLVTVSSCVAAPSADDLQLGIKTMTKTGQDICWYEYLSQLPSLTAPKSSKFGSCYLNLNGERLIEVWKAKKLAVTDYDFVKGSMGPNIVKYVKQFLPEKYAICNEFLKLPEKKFAKLSSLLDDLPKKEFPYAGWANCVLDQLQTIHTDAAIAELKKKWSETPNYQNVLLDRENANRARHGADPLELDEELNGKAQEFADQLAKVCGNYSEAMKDHDNTLNDEPLGMSIYLWNIGMNSPPANDALHAANVWYESGETYPWPEYVGDGRDAGFQAFGQFSQTVWKGSKKAGYGMGKAADCNYTMIVGKYFPRGNMLGEFKDNVLPAQ